MTAPLVTAYRFAREMIAELHRLLEEKIGDRTVRFTLVIAVPSETGDEKDMFVQVAGNGTPRLTRAMLTAAVLQHETARADGPVGRTI